MKLPIRVSALTAASSLAVSRWLPLVVAAIVLVACQEDQRLF